MSYSRLLQNLGFDADPFAKTNADDEVRLEKYFVPPPFFQAVYGDPRTPKSAIVFAPRGGGKTALKRKIELESHHHPILCLSYNHFNLSNVKVTHVDSDYHLNNIVQLVLIGILSAIYVRGLQTLNNDDRHLIYLLTKRHLSRITQAELKAQIANIKNLSDKASELWDRFTGPVALVLNNLLQRVGLGITEIQKFELEKGTLGPLTDQLGILRAIAKKLHYRGVYVLVDRVDETGLTNSVNSCYRFIAPMLNDLHLLEMDGFAFKFFLWDLLLAEYRDSARPDRVKHYSLGWTYDDLRQMLSQRLKAFSISRHILSFGTIADSELPLPIDFVIAVFAQGSPRNLIRICKEIFDQQSELDHSVSRISNDAIEMGIQRIADSIAHEMYDDAIIKDLQRTKRCDFTIRHVYGDVFKFTQQAGLNKVRAWENTDAVFQLGTVQETKNSKPSNHYAMTHILLAKYVFSQMSVAEFLKNKIRTCSHCREILLRDWDVRSPQRCHECQTDIK